MPSPVVVETDDQFVVGLQCAEEQVHHTRKVWYNLCTSVGFLRGDGMIDRIAVDTKIHFGKPCVAGTRITVQSVLELLDEGLSFDEIIRDYYPDLATQDIQACVQYAIALVAAEDIHLAVAPA